MTRLAASTPTRGRCATALFLLLVAVAADFASAGRHYGRYRGGGVSVTKTTTVSAGGGRGRYRSGYGRRLLFADAADTHTVARHLFQDDAGADEDTAAKVAELKEKNGGCLTMLDIIQTTPELSDLAAAIADLPMVTKALGNKDRTDTFFAPTNDAIDSLVAWGGFKDKAKGIQEILGDISLKALIVAYHAVPGTKHSADDLEQRGKEGSGNFLDTGLEKVLKSDLVKDKAKDAGVQEPGAGAVAASEPLLIEDVGGKLTIKAIGSEANVVTPDLQACNGVVHTIDNVLLPFDGDGELDPEQKANLAKIEKRLEAMKKEEPEQ